MQRPSGSTEPALSSRGVTPAPFAATKRFGSAVGRRQPASSRDYFFDDAQNAAGN